MNLAKLLSGLSVSLRRTHRQLASIPSSRQSTSSRKLHFLGRHMPWLRLLLIAIFLLPLLPKIQTLPARAAGVCDIVCENAKPGNPPSQWDVTGGNAGAASIQGFATDISVNAGNTISFKVNTTSTNYSLTIYRMGYYQGNGARQVAVVTPSVPLPQTQPNCLTVSATGLIDCGNWAVSASWAVPSDAVSGVYFAKLIDAAPGAASSHIPFVVRNDASTSAIVFRTNDTTWAAYNDYGGNSFYYGNAPTGCGINNGYSCGRAYKVSYNRPFNDRSESGGYGTSNYFFYAEFPMIRWMESNGYDVSYISTVDMDRNPALLLNHKIIVSAGHDEYWSAAERAALQSARDSGVNIASFTGNTGFWKTRYENSIDTSATPYRTMVCYKETVDSKVEDPLGPATWTGTWRDPRFSPPGDGGKPENAILGTAFTVNRGSADPVLTSAFANLRFWRNTAVAGLTGSQTVTLGTQTIGYEWDEDLDNGFRPAGLFNMAATSVNVPERIADYGNTYVPGTGVWGPTSYKAPSGATVFSAGTVQWVWGLDIHHDLTPDTGPSAPNVTMQQATVNLFADMHAQPASLQSGLVAATASTDTTPPSSAVTSPAPNATVQGSALVISGSASDTGGGVVAGVEVSVDGGSTWHKAAISTAAGSTTWNYGWNPDAQGNVTIKSRAVDDSGNIETPSAGIAITITCPCRLGYTKVGSLKDAGDSNNINGSRFTASSGGTISSMSVYVGAISAAPNNQYQLAIYTDTNGVPGTLLASSATGTLTANSWNSIPVSATLSPNTAYWLAYNTNGTSNLNSLQYDSPVTGVTEMFSTAAVTFGSWPSTFSATTVPSWAFSIYATISGTGATSTPTATSTPSAPTATGIPGSPTVTPTNTPIPPTATNTATATNTPTVTNTPTATSTPAPTSTPVTCPCSTIFTASSAPAVDSSGDVNAVEIGVKFTSDVSGYVSGIRFYKGAANSGIHVGNLWSNTGQLLASATFTNETASGWQQVLFSTPIAVTAGTVYVASYHANAGNYSATSNTFVSAVN
ncbi:MAG: Mo-co oxidoreductase dimerization domain protein, partial [Chloroflexi bacterium]|nr:Mo-co oxidoreductase dimerization domain protein [Chloroflexota bacterium]